MTTYTTAEELAAYFRKHPGGSLRYRIENLSGCQSSEAALDRLIADVEKLLEEPMRQSIHHHYEQLAEKERAFVDAIFDGKAMYELAQQHGVPLAGDDRVERAVEALAKAVIESRKS